MKNSETQLSEYDIKLNEEYDRIQAKYKFPMSFIHLYDIREGSEKNKLRISDGCSSLYILMDGIFIYEGSDRWILSKEGITIDLLKATRKIDTFIL